MHPQPTSPLHTLSMVEDLCPILRAGRLQGPAQVLNFLKEAERILALTTVTQHVTDTQTNRNVCGIRLGRVHQEISGPNDEDACKVLLKEHVNAPGGRRDVRDALAKAKDEHESVGLFDWSVNIVSLLHPTSLYEAVYRSDGFQELELLDGRAHSHTPKDPYLYVSNVGAGTPFHVDAMLAAAVNVHLGTCTYDSSTKTFLPVTGHNLSKRWYFISPRAMPVLAAYVETHSLGSLGSFRVALSDRQWRQVTLSITKSLGQGLFVEFEQNIGDMVFVPPGWWHQVVTVSKDHGGPGPLVFSLAYAYDMIPVTHFLAFAKSASAMRQLGCPDPYQALNRVFDYVRGLLRNSSSPPPPSPHLQSLSDSLQHLHQLDLAQMRRLTHNFGPLVFRTLGCPASLTNVDVTTVTDVQCPHCEVAPFDFHVVVAAGEKDEDTYCLDCFISAKPAGVGLGSPSKFKLLRRYQPNTFTELEGLIGK